MRKGLRSALCAAVLAAGCRQPAPPAAAKDWEKHPGLDPHPAGQTLEGSTSTALPRTSFRLDPQRNLAAAERERKPATEEEQLYRKAADEGQVWAQVKLGTIYSRQTDDTVLLAEGLRLLNSAADKNDPEALRLLSQMALEGRGMQQSDKEAYKFMRRAADLGSPAAQLDLAQMIAAGRGMARDPEVAIGWARKAADQGHTPAQVALARQLINSSEEARRNEALELLQKASDGGDAEAALFLAGVLVSGRFSVPKDELRAESLLMLWANRGNSDAQLALAAVYKTSETFAERREEALMWLQRAAEAGNAKAIQALGGGLGPTGEDEQRYAEAASRGEAWAQTRLGKIYVEKTNDEEAIARGVSLLRNAAAQKDAEALFILGGLAAAGRGLPQSVLDSFEYCRRAAELGYAEAQYELAAMYGTGQAVPIDETKALEWAGKSAAQGNIKAKFSFGRLLLLRGNEADRDTAVRLLGEAAKAGIPESALFLAEAHAEGLHGLARNTEEALRILRPMAEQGNSRANSLLVKIRQEKEN